MDHGREHSGHADDGQSARVAQSASPPRSVARCARPCSTAANTLKLVPQTLNTQADGVPPQAPDVQDVMAVGRGWTAVGFREPLPWGLVLVLMTSGIELSHLYVSS